MNDYLKEKLRLLPQQPGCYLMKDRAGTIIYVGKAKKLQNRVRSYFVGQHSGKTARLVQEIVDFEYIVTSSESEALALEINLIQKNQPRYNIMLKDNSSYPYLKLTKEKYPRLELTREWLQDGSEYFGPYPDVQAASEVKRILDRLYPLRKCGPNEKRPCFYHHLHECSCPYYFHLDEATYAEEVKKVQQFLKGNMEEVAQCLEEKMRLASAALDFETAAEYRNEWQAVLKMQEEQKVSKTDGKDRDIIGYAHLNQQVGIQIFHIRKGKMIQRNMADFPLIGTVEDCVLSYLAQFYQQNLIPEEILVPVSLSVSPLQDMLNTCIRSPKRGEKHAFVDLACKNASKQLQDNAELSQHRQRWNEQALKELKEQLQLPSLHRIEAFDNSHWQGSANVSGLVCYIDGRKAPQQYRKYKIKESQADDYEAMREVIYRRYRRQLKEHNALPDLILMDGGKGQVDCAREVLKEQLGLNIPVAGMVKDERHKTKALLYGEPLREYPLEKTSFAFRFIENVQEEVHRYAISFHRQLRSKESFASYLEQISGIGPKRRRLLLQHFNNLEEIKQAQVDDFKKIGLSTKVAQQIVDFFVAEGAKSEKM